MKDRERDEAFMEMALAEALKAGREGEVPVGAVLTKGNRVLARDHNRCIQRNDPTAHAEVLVLRKSGKILKNYHLLLIAKMVRKINQTEQKLKLL